MIRTLFQLTCMAGITGILLALATPSHRMHHRNSADHARIIRCGVDWKMIDSWLEDADIPPITGAGNYHWKISTKSDSAQFYFDQGISTYYSFHIIESLASFKKARRFDPHCAMLAWAEALAYGPNINDLGYSASPDALAATNRANELRKNATIKEAALIDAMLVRYSPDSTISRASLNQAYADKMKAAWNKYPDDADIATLYADALMLQHPWDLWYPDGKPKQWTPAIEALLEKILVKSPNNPGANHYYIHVMEPSPTPEKALASANRLGKLTPGLSHTVHMPSHIYLRTGNYNLGVSVNENAIAHYKAEIPLFNAITANDFLYIIHNLHMQTNNAMLAGRANYSVASAEDTRKSIAPDYLAAPAPLGNYIQYVFMTPALVDVRFGRWDEILAKEKPANQLSFANIIDCMARGMAFLHRNNLSAARSSLAELQHFMKDSVLNLPMTPFSPAIDAAQIANQLLQGSIYLEEKNYAKAIEAFKMAVSVEENMVYNEPRDWLLNPKHWLGNAYLEAGQFAHAEKVFAEDLKNNRNNVWALKGLLIAREKLHKKEASATRLLFKTATAKADMAINGPVL